MQPTAWGWKNAFNWKFIMLAWEIFAAVWSAHIPKTIPTPSLPPTPSPTPSPTPTQSQSAGKLIKILMAAANVLVDIICLIIGGIGLRKRFPKRALQRMSREMKPALAEIERIVQQLGRGSSFTEKVKVAWDILLALKNTFCLQAVVHAFMKSLTWWQMIVYGASSIITIAGIFLSGGALLYVKLAESALCLVSFVQDVFALTKVIEEEYN